MVECTAVGRSRTSAINRERTRGEARTMAFLGHDEETRSRLQQVRMSDPRCRMQWTVAVGTSRMSQRPAAPDPLGPEPHNTDSGAAENL